MPLDQFAQTAHLRAARDEGHDVPARPRRCGRGSRRPRSCTPLRLAVRGSGHADAARDRPRSDGAPDGRRRRPRGPVQHRGRPGDLLPHAARRRRAIDGVRDPVAADGREDDDAGDAAGRARTSAASAGTSIRRSRPTAASCCRSARSATPGSPARRCGSIRRRETFVVFLSNRVHPDGKGDVTPLRARVATIAASAIADAARRSRPSAADDRDATSAPSAPAPARAAARRRC